MAGTKCSKNDIQREITQRQHEVELQLLGTALTNIAINKRTKFQVIRPEMTKLYSGQARNAIKMKVKWGNNSKFVLGSYGSCVMHSIIFQQLCISNLKLFRL